MEEYFCRTCLAAMPAAKFWLGFAVVAGVTLGALFVARKSFIKARLIEDMPTSRVRSASQGYVELIGTALTQGPPLVAPLTSQPCLWWRYKIERYQKSGKSSSWRTVDSGVSEEPFFMSDDTGICRIEPDGAEISCLHRRVWRGATRVPDTARLTVKAGLLDVLNPVIGRGRYRYTEFLIREGDPLYLLGHFVSDASGRRVLTVDQVTGQVIREWKTDFDSLLVKFDSDGNGELDQREWSSVREAARVAGRERQLENAGEAVEHVLVKPEDSGLPFLIGSHGQEELSRRFRRHAAIGAVAFLAAGSLAAWMAGGRFVG